MNAGTLSGANRCVAYRVPNLSALAGKPTPRNVILYQVLNLLGPPDAQRRTDWGLRRRCGRIRASCPRGTDHPAPPTKRAEMSKRARKRRSRKGNAANHGRKPNA
ncbi:hypothetical protein DN585_11775 [Intrasporangium calvum]|nr:hypothetical protein DN585_11775 [Intrasporangium calvum]